MTSNANLPSRSNGGSSGVDSGCDNTDVERWGQFGDSESSGTPSVLAPSVNDDGVITVGLEGIAPGEAVGLGLPTWLLACRYDTMTSFEIAAYFGQITSGPPILEAWEEAGLDPDIENYIVFCSPGPEAQAANPGIVLSGVLDFWEVGDPFPGVIQDWLIARSIASVNIPIQVGQSAPFGGVDAPMITQLPTWLWVDDAIWQPVSATPAPVFGVSVTATATPYEARYDGDGDEPVLCGENSGGPYNFSLADSDQSSICTVTYRHSSSVGDYVLRSEVFWRITWACSSVCGSGVLEAPFVAERTRVVVVAELQAIAIG